MSSATYATDSSSDPHSMSLRRVGQCPAHGIHLQGRCSLNSGRTFRHTPSLLSSHATENASSTLKANTLYQFIMGLNDVPVEMDAKSQQENLGDLFPTLLDKVYPLTLIDLIDQARKIFPKTLSVAAEQQLARSSQRMNIQVFRIAEAGMVPASIKPQPDRTYRIAIAIFAQKGQGNPDIFVSTGSLIDSDTQFLQLMSWDDKNKVFNFYARLQNTWMWAGNSQHSLEPKTRGLSPFCGHANGATLMKELKAPWVNWRSSVATFDDSILPSDSPLITKYPFLSDRSEESVADTLELLVRSGMSRWNNPRITKSITGNSLNNIPYFMRQILSTTIINLTSSPSPSDPSHTDPITIPITFFLNAEAFSALGFTNNFTAVSVDKPRYLATLKKYGSALDDGKGFMQSGDTYFGFVVPEPAAEDTSLLKILINKKILSPRLAACFLMIDYSNPIYSTQRAALLEYIPDSVTKSQKDRDFISALENVIVTAISQSPAAKTSGTPEFIFMQNWAIAQQDNWITTFGQTLSDYWNKATQNANTDAGFDQFFQLAESRRWLFKQTPLFEFPLTFATTNIPDSTFPLIMQVDGKVTSGTQNTSKFSAVPEIHRKSDFEEKRQDNVND